MIVFFTFVLKTKKKVRDVVAVVQPGSHDHFIAAHPYGQLDRRPFILHAFDCRLRRLCGWTSRYDLGYDRLY